MPEISEFIAGWQASPFGARRMNPWDATAQADALLSAAMAELGADYVVRDGVAIHSTATVEAGAVVKGPAWIGPDVFVAATAYLRGGVFLDRNCTIGPSCELKTVFMFAGAKIAHLSFVGDSLIGAGVNIEAGAIVANYRNERDDKRIRIRWRDEIIDTGVDKFGALIGDGARIGANAVIAPGALIAPGARIARLVLVDQG